MIDITNYKQEINNYGGSELKATYIINGEKYMVKMPDPIRKKTLDLGYMNNQYSEYIGCHIFESVGIPVQKTMLVKLNKDGKEKIAVACKDFLNPGEELIEISNVSLSLSTEKKYKISIEDVYEIINKMSVNYKLDENKLISNFWDMFVVDALIGNTDRHFGNWGFIKKDDSLTMAPVYDCGSSLHLLLSEEIQSELMKNPVEFKSKSYNLASVYKMNGQKIIYHEIFKNPPVDLKETIKRIVPKIDIEKIKKIIASTEGLSKTQKEYYFKDILLRKEEILDKSYNEIKI